MRLSIGLLIVVFVIELQNVKRHYTVVHKTAPVLLSTDIVRRRADVRPSTVPTIQRSVRRSAIPIDTNNNRQPRSTKRTVDPVTKSDNDDWTAEPPRKRVRSNTTNTDLKSSVSTTDLVSTDTDRKAAVPTIPVSTVSVPIVSVLTVPTVSIPVSLPLPLPIPVAMLDLSTLPLLSAPSVASKPLRSGRPTKPLTDERQQAAARILCLLASHPS